MAKNSRTLVPAEQLATEQHGASELSPEQLLQYQKQFGYTREELEQVIWVLAKQGEEATGSMGDDTPMAVLSKSHARSMTISDRNSLKSQTRLSIRCVKST